ncbi:MAG: hypothetical protein L3J06_02965 [Cyclobacteriaceae bacterium]|nr:hypothetical protein [Cyclobacteriaceae bacterium]
MKLAITLIAALIVLIFYKKIVAKVSSSKIFLNKKYDNYRYLYKNTTESKNYKILKITDRTPRFILFDKVAENFILTGDELYLTTIRKINNKGEEIDSLEIKGHLYPSGMYFYEDYFIDWAITGNKSKQKYDAIIEYDSLSKKELEYYLSNATIIDFTQKYKNLESYKGRCHLKIQDKWIVIESKKMFKELEKHYEKDYFELEHRNLSKKNGDRLIALKNQLIPFHNWEKPNSMIFIQKFSKESYSRQSLFGNFNNHGLGTGWHGTGYFQLAYKSEIFNFKSYAFKSKQFSLNPYISMYFPEKEYNIDFSFIKITNSPGTRQPSGNSGLYVLKKK